MHWPQLLQHWLTCPFINACQFPNCLKNAELSPVFKKEDSVSKTNFRPVSILIWFTKNWKAVLWPVAGFLQQNCVYISICFPKRLQLWSSLDWNDWRLDKMFIWTQDCCGNDLGEAFDCLPHRLLLAKLSACGLSNDSSNLLMSYLSECVQRVKIDNSRSSCSEIIKGVPQGSITGPLLFNVFTNDIFYVIENVYNYAGDNVLSCSGDSPHEVAASLESSTRTAPKWFGNNLMQANPSKFQAIVFGLKTKDDDICFNINGNKVGATKCVKQLGVNFDEHLSFDEHISHLCIKAARQLNSLQKIAKYLNQNTNMIVFNCFISSNFDYNPWV